MVQRGNALPAPVTTQSIVTRGVNDNKESYFIQEFVYLRILGVTRVLFIP